MEKYLVIQLARFGDIIQSKRLISALMQDGEVTLLTDNNLCSLAKLIYPTVNCMGIAASGSTSQRVFEENSKVFQALSQEQFDEIYPLNHSNLCQAISMLFEPERLMGYSRHHGYARHSNWVRMAFRWLGNRKKTPINLVDFWGMLAKNPYPAHLVNPKAQGKGHGIGIVLSGQNARRSLPAEYYAKIIPIVFQRLQNNNTLQDNKIYLLGTQKEQKFAEALLVYLPKRLHPFTENLAGKTSFQDLQEILANLELLLSPDTGTAHFASHLGTPVEGFYLSSANVFETGPYGEGHTIWQAYLSCTPCGEFETCSSLSNKEPNCLLAYKDPHFLYHLLHMKFDEQSLINKPLQNIIPYFSSFAEKGQTSNFLNWQSPLHLPHDLQRQKDKNILENYCLATKNLQTDRNLHNIEDNAIYAETDWIFPQRKP